MSSLVLIAAGGTGGHMFPALAVAAELRRRGTRVALLTDQRGARWAAAEPDTYVIDAASPSGGIKAVARAALSLARGLMASRSQLASLRPDAAAAFGGYASVPAAAAAAMRRVPLLVHEQNAVMGRANRFLARLSSVLALSFERTASVPSLRGTRRIVPGNPVRPGFMAVGRPAATTERISILVLGGSQGARVFSDVLPAAIGLLPEPLRRRIALTQQCRPEDLERVRAGYQAMGQEVELQSFFSDVPSLMAKADLVVSRSGASTIAEILLVGRPSLLVPYQFAADDHQTANARQLEQAGAAILLPQPEATPERMSTLLSDLLEQPQRLRAMSMAAAALARPAAAAELADALEAMAQREPRP